jgi:hypothetical protein
LHHIKAGRGGDPVGLPPSSIAYGRERCAKSKPGALMFRMVDGRFHFHLPEHIDEGPALAGRRRRVPENEHDGSLFRSAFPQL